MPGRKASMICSCVSAFGALITGLLAMENFFNEEQASPVFSGVMSVAFIVFLFTAVRLYKRARG